MISFFISFLFTFMLVLFVVKYAGIHEAVLDSDLRGVQKVHAHAVPRIGGLCIFVGVALAFGFTAWRNPELGLSLGYLLGCSAIAFLGGIVEDFTKSVSPARRLGLTIVAALVGYYLFPSARIEHITWNDINWPLTLIWISLPLTLLAVAGIAHAVNIIDGFNGLASVVTICMLLSLAYVALQVNDMFILVVALMIAGATAGFFVWNYPAGLIFLGDGGAYFLGFLLGELSIMLAMRNPQVSTWYPVLLLIYPSFETLFSAYRRIFWRGTSPGMPDGIHLHSLIFRRMVVWAVGKRDGRALTRRNAMTSPYLWLLSLMAVLPATAFWRYTWALIACSLLFIVTYIWLYVKIVRFRSPRWMIVGRKKK